jgi:hypothetical protein
MPSRRLLRLSNLKIQLKAVQALRFFQSPKDEFCSVIQSYMKFLKTESLLEI